ncbi:hypothetical protein ASD64_11205 [Mesorhizobium sp. Root157]|nr:hypothetical protein ASD64_11205 [Mesorhizobium sp. Root157]
MSPESGNRFRDNDMHRNRYLEHASESERSRLALGRSLSIVIPEFSFERSEKGVSGIHAVTLRQYANGRMRGF